MVVLRYGLHCTGYYLDKEHGDNLPGARIEQCKRWTKE